MTITEWIATATQQLHTVGIPSPQLDAELILAHTLHKNRTYLHAHADESFDQRRRHIADARLSLRLDRVPVAYIIGHKEFYGRRFKVTPATLIPRPESETLISLLQTAIKTAPADGRLVDVGTGSGVLGITAKLLYPHLHVTLIDKSAQALMVAAHNAKALAADVVIQSGDLLVGYPYKAAIIIANLPYVDASWDRSPETNHEPADALFADKNGTELIIQLFEQTQHKLALGGSLIIEADPEQHEALIHEAAQRKLIVQAREGYGILFTKLG